MEMEKLYSASAVAHGIFCCSFVGAYQKYLLLIVLLSGTMLSDVNVSLSPLETNRRDPFGDLKKAAESKENKDASASDDGDDNDDEEDDYSGDGGEGGDGDSDDCVGANGDGGSGNGDDDNDDYDDMVKITTTTTMMVILIVIATKRNRNNQRRKRSEAQPHFIWFRLRELRCYLFGDTLYTIRLYCSCQRDKTLFMD